jgi:hypothetical protein
MRLGNTSSTPGSSGSNSRYYDIVVGNATTGDTLAVCDVLDTGNGEALAATLLAAATFTPVKSVFIRRGVYDRGAAGSTGTPLVVPVGVLAVGDGQNQVTIQAPSNPGALATPTIKVLTILGEVRDIGVSVPDLTSADTSGNTAVVQVGSDPDFAKGTLRNFQIVWGSTFQSDGSNLGAVVAGIEVFSGSVVTEVQSITAPTFQSDGTSPFAAMALLGSNAFTTRVNGFSVVSDMIVFGFFGGGYGLLLNTTALAEISNISIDDAVFAGIVAVAGGSLQLASVAVLFNTGNSSGTIRYGILVSGNNTQVVALSAVKGLLRNTSAGSGPADVGIGMVATGGAGRIFDCEFSNFMIFSFSEAGHISSAGGAIVARNGIVDTNIGQNTVGINNVSDAEFRTGGNW